jgi:hypothetical protein
MWPDSAACANCVSILALPSGRGKIPMECHTRIHRAFALLVVLALGACQATHQYTNLSKIVTPAAGEAKSFQIVAREHWRNTGIQLKAGTEYRIVADGSWRMSPHCNQKNANGGVLQYTLFCQDALNIRPVVAVNFQTLIARIGPFGALLPVGKHLEFSAEEDGVLYLGPNDNQAWLFGSTGLLSVKVARTDPAPPPGRAASKPLMPARFAAPAQKPAASLAKIDMGSLDFGNLHALVIRYNTYADWPKLGTARVDADRWGVKPPIRLYGNLIAGCDAGPNPRCLRSGVARAWRGRQSLNLLCGPL